MLKKMFFRLDIIAEDMGVCDVRKLKVRRKAPDESRIADFTQKFVLQVGVKSAILCFKARRRGSFFSPKLASLCCA
jgi:hypothetical protein